MLLQALRAKLAPTYPQVGGIAFCLLHELVRHPRLVRLHSLARPRACLGLHLRCVAWRRQGALRRQARAPRQQRAALTSTNTLSGSS